MKNTDKKNKVTCTVKTVIKDKTTIRTHFLVTLSLMSITQGGNITVILAPPLIEL